MPEYVYALHEFTPENPDEVPFKVAERIEVLEKDDLYGDGWWQGRNASGTIGLFPQSYTSSEPPASSISFPDTNVLAATSDEPSPAVLQPLPEEFESNPTHDDNPRTALQIASGSGGRAKQAIEQLGRGHRDGSRSFSFASSHGDYTDRSEPDTDSDANADAEDEDNGLGWHKGARRKLALRAQQENEQRQAREAEDPCQLPLEAEDEENASRIPRRPSTRAHPHIPEEDEEQEQGPVKESHVDDSDNIVPSDKFIVPDESNLPTATAYQISFPEPEPSPVPSSLTLPSPAPPLVQIIDLPPPEQVTNEASPTPVLGATQSAAPSITPTPSTIHATEQPLSAIPPPLPSPTTSSAGSYGVNGTGIQQTLTPATTVSSLKSSVHAPLTAQQECSTVGPSDTTDKSPSEWNVEEVVVWLRSKGFDQGVCDKFIEQEITGDVLLELDANILKTEIGIVAFGKRVRIVNAISELRRPSSVSEPEQQPQSALAPMTPRSQSHSFNYTYPHSHTASMQSSAQQSYNNSPIYVPPSPSVTNGLSPMGMTSIASPESPPHTGDVPASPFSRSGWRTSDPASAHSGSGGRRLGLGLAQTVPFSNGKTTKQRPAQLVLSPSDSALGEAEGGDQPAKAEDRAVMSESESTLHQDAKGRRRRLFGRSVESSSSKEKAASLKDTASIEPPASPRSSAPASASPHEPKEDAVTKRHAKGRRSVDEWKSDRLSLFGGSFPERLGSIESRPETIKVITFSEPSDSGEEGIKPPWYRRRYCSQGERKGEREGETPLSLSPNKDRDPTLLRKRTMSGSEIPTRSTIAAAGGPNLKAGHSILEQIGTPDHNGWMRKKGDRYNTWKLRYFVLKGPHLYWLRSNSTSETKIKGYINIVDKAHYFSSDEQVVIREWMKALMKATINRDYTSPVMSSCNIPTIPLTVAQAMNPAPRPPSPSARDATQKALRREIPTSCPDSKGPHAERTRLESFFTNDTVSSNGAEGVPAKKLATAKSPVPPRPSREMRRLNSAQSDYQGPVDTSLIEWANSHLPTSLHIVDKTGPLCSGLALLRLAEDIRGKPSSPPVPDSAFPSSPNDDKLDGLFRLFDYLLDNDVKMGTVSINDIRQGKREKIVQLLRALKSWEEKRRNIAQSIGKGSMTAGPFMAGPDEIQVPSQSPVLLAAKNTVQGDFRDLTSPSSRDLFAISRRYHSGRELLRLTCAVACLHAFIQANWTGPDLDVKPLDVISVPTELSELLTDELLHQKAISELRLRGEPAYHLAKVAIFLQLARLLLDTPFQYCQSIPWWRLRTWLVLQQVLDEPVASPPEVLTSVEPLIHTFASHPDLAGRLILEQGLLEHYLQYELTGALGKRTKFQQTAVTQLVLLAESRTREDGAESEKVHDNNAAESVPAEAVDTPHAPNPAVPETLLLNDDTLLEQTAFTSSSAAVPGSRLAHLDPSAQPALHPLDQCILLSLCLNVKNTSPVHGLTAEQMAPYVARVISHPRNWSAHTMALLLRSRLESDRTRTVERSTLQLQALVDQMPTADSTVAERLLYIHSIPLPSRWEMEKELAMRFFSLGVVKSALEIFERLEMWEEVVKCWQSMERRDKGVAIVRDLLEGRKAEESPRCHSGGQVVVSARRPRAHNALEHYNRAWSISKETSGRAMRSLGGYYFARGDFPNTITCLRRAVAINPLLGRSWFVLGCAYVRQEDWEGARDAFVRCVTIDDEDGESWSNLASVYLRMGEAGKTAALENGEDEETDKNTTDLTQRADSDKSIPFANKMLAFRALKQGLKYRYDNWRMWSNYMIVAMDVGELSEACRALARVVEERSAAVGAACVDEDVLERLVDAATRVPADADDAALGAEGAARNASQGHGLFRRVTDLFERTILPRVSSPRIFRARARLLTWQGRWEEALNAYLDGYRCSIAGTMERGETDVERWREAVGEVEEIVDVLRNFGPRSEGSNWKLQARSILRTFMGRTKDFEDEPQWSRLTELQEDIRREE
ncbi:TPR repeat-containing protein C19B12.01 [Grifola frondosa]|uniref:TPR repeat-containing protein C19B12.01 n=1 Tax=Grifola frondosa TaxID=5627 RepID=A0A1C7M157_GRIFR|nr:TPR repeat-containing protein C19B12.01 [Grifola frondosa]